jgi:hypothetical protein
MFSRLLRWSVAVVETRAVGRKEGATMAKRRWLMATVSVVIGTVCSRAGVACNPGFIPGDAFFHSELTSDFVSRMRVEGGALLLHYAYPEPLSGCGYSGFATLKVEGCPASLGQQLRLVYQAARSIEPRVVRIVSESDKVERAVEINALHMFVYNKGADWRAQKIGLKYNEHWYDFAVDVRMAKKLQRTPVAAYVYAPFVPLVDAVAEDWQFSRRFAGLGASVPDVQGWGLPGEEITIPVTMKYADLEMVITLDKLESYFRRKEDATFYVIHGETSAQFRWHVNGANLELQKAAVGAEWE